ncbi:hypothetical protein IAU59_006247 [Kwoniella sp. CBS 9459]
MNILRSRPPQAVALSRRLSIRRYATQNQPPPTYRPVNQAPSTRSPLKGLGDNPLNRYIEARTETIMRQIPLHNDHHDRSGLVLPFVLPYEAYPEPQRRADTSRIEGLPDLGDGKLTVVHMVIGEDKRTTDFAVCSGFVINPTGFGNSEQVVVTCSHTLDQISFRYPQSQIHSFILPSKSSNANPIPITSYLTSSISDLLICSIPILGRPLRTLPVSPFPIYRGQEVLVHELHSMIDNHTTVDASREPSAWRTTEMMGYRGYNWREVLPGTSSSLPYIVFSDRPKPGSSGGPILDAQSGAVIGVVSGSRTLSAVEGERGYGSSAENIFELFSLPGFVPSSTKKRDT